MKSNNPKQALSGFDDVLPKTVINEYLKTLQKIILCLKLLISNIEALVISAQQWMVDSKQLGQALQLNH